MRRVGDDLRRHASLAGLACCALLFAGNPLAAPDAREILRRAEKVRSPELDYAVDFRLDVTQPKTSWKQRTARYTMIARGKDYSLVVMREPKAFHPGTLLITEGAYWLLLPRSEKPFQLAPRQVLNGDISNGDLARGNLPTFYDPRRDGEEEVRGEACYRLELTRKSNLGPYKRMRAWITVDGFRPRKFEYYGETGALLKTAYYERYTDGEIGLRSMRIEVENHVRPGENTVLTFSNLRRFDSSRLPFTRERLNAVRDAFLTKYEADGEQAQPEEVLELLGARQP